MVSQLVSSDAPAGSGPRRFWLRALLLLPALKVVVLAPTAMLAPTTVESGAFAALVAVLGLGEILLLASQAAAFRMNGWALMAAMLGNALLTTAGLFAAGIATLFVMCQSGNCPIS